MTVSNSFRNWSGFKLGVSLLFVGFPLSGQQATPAGQAGPAGLEFFEKSVRPILANRCFPCHGPGTGEGQAQLRLDSLAGMLEGGRSGPVIVPGEPQRSLMIHAVNHDTFVQMPPKTKLPRQEIQLLTKWVEIGAPWPNAQLPAKPNKAKANEGTGAEFTAEQKSHWAFQPVAEPAVPGVRDGAWPQSPIDYFVLSRLEAKGLPPAASAKKRTLLRRATIDLLGLPPTPEEVAAFLADDSPEAFGHVVDRLLASPRYGERWGRRWLDVARYADSNGMDDNLVYGDAWRYRDYVIAAFNNDKPYDEFVRQQLAGDLLTEWGDERRAESLVATGFLMIGPKMVGEDDPVKQQLDFADEQLATTARAFLGLTVDCARCHDHKFDPIPSADYYAMLGIFTSTKTMLSYRVTSKWNATALHGPEDEERLTEIERAIDIHDDILTNGNQEAMSEEQREDHKQKLKAAKEAYEAIPKAMAVGEGEIKDLPVLHRGSHLTPGEIAPRGFLKIVAREDQPAIGAGRSGRRELAVWIADAGNPLTARVMVNRIWQGHFGQGIVRSPDNFGLLGEAPDNPPLLDWLASRFVSSGWSVKAMHRLIMLSSTYQMSTAADPGAAEADPENRLLAHRNRQRMEAEVIRDSLLAVSGRLDPAMGGTLIPHATFENLNVEGKSRDPKLYDSRRRSVYLPVLRSALYEVFGAFDFADPSVINGQRGSTTVAPQALFMMNSDLMSQAARGFAETLLAGEGDDEQRISRAYEVALSRPADREEVRRWRAFLANYERALDEDAAEPAKRRQQAWQAMARVLLSSNEFVYVE